MLYKKGLRMGKYNTAIHVLFWTLVVFLLFIALLYLWFNKDVFTTVSSDSEPAGHKEFTVREVTEPKEDVEWYYFMASGYSANDPSQGTNNITATGKKIAEGMVAVDPEVIPLGTRIEIKDMGTFIAEDTGGKIKGNRIDIYFDSKEEAKNFGIKGIWVKMVDNNYKLVALSKNDQYSSRYMSR